MYGTHLSPTIANCVVGCGPLMRLTGRFNICHYMSPFEEGAVRNKNKKNLNVNRTNTNCFQ